MKRGGARLTKGEVVSVAGGAAGELRGTAARPLAPVRVVGVVVAHGTGGFLEVGGVPARAMRLIE